ncbi:MAG: hypothetical protein AAGD33_13820 [Actinomycetota bacterium]
MTSVPLPAGDDRSSARSTRRRFLIGASTLVAAACSSTDESDSTASTDSAAGTEPPSTERATIATDPVSATESAPDSDPPDAGVDPAATADTGSVVPLLTPAMFDGLSICTATSPAGEGPFPSPELLDRRDIAEGSPGHPLRLGLRVVDESCAPVPGARVDIWHTDASGDYSAFTDNGDGKDEGEGTTFCRGLQTADDNGILEFQTIFPGWYPGRTVHIHATVRVSDGPALTTQLYFDEAVTAAILETGEYAQFGQPDTTWATDGLIGDPSTDGTGVALESGDTWNGPGTLGLINLGVGS